MSKLKWLTNAIAEQFTGYWALKLGGVLVGTAVSILQAIFAIDSGIPYWIAIMYAVITLLVVVTISFFISGVLLKRKSQTAHADNSPPPAQNMTQTGVSINNSPIINVGQIAEEAGSKKQVEREYVSPPVFETVGTRVVRRVIDVNTNTLIEDKFLGEEKDLALNERLVDVALAKIRYRADVGVPPSMHVMAHLLFRATSEGTESDIDYGVWWPDELSRSQTFHAGDRHELVVALIMPDIKTCCITYEHHTKPHKLPATTYRYLSPTIAAFNGTEFLIKVDLTVKRVNEVVDTKSLEYRLALTPKLIFEEASAVRGIIEQPAKNAGVAVTLRHLSELAEEGTQILNGSLGVNVDWSRANDWAGRVEECMKEQVSEDAAAYLALSVTKPYPGLAVNRAFVDFIHTRIQRIGEIASELRRR
jgi:hypothetical protein